MEDKKYTSVAEIDADLEDEFAEVDDDETEEDVEEEEDELLDDDDSAFEEEEETEETTTPKKPSKEEQRAYSFVQLRKEKEAAEVALLAEQEFYRKLAKASGYGDDVAQYRKDLENRLISEEAKSQGLPPETYKELEDAKQKLKKFETEREESERSMRSQKFIKTVDKVLKSYDIDPKETSKILFDNLQKAGYTLDTLLTIPEPEFLIRGALYDHLAKANVKEERIGGLDTKRIKSASGKTKTIDDMVDEEVAAYAKSKGMKYVK